MIFWLATGKGDRLRIIRGLEFQVELIFTLEGVGWGGHCFIWSKRVYYHCLMVFSVLASCTRCLFGPGLGWSKLGVRKSRLSAKFEFRYESSKDTKAPGGLILGTLLGPSYAINLS